MKNVRFRTEKLSNLVLADWNYKEDDESMKEKLKAGIKRNGFLMNLVVRKLGSKYEVVDGNHRLVALKELGYTEIQVCDVGDISQEQAKVISITLNETSFDNNEWQLSVIMKELVDEFSIDEMEEVMPFELGEISAMIEHADIDFEDMDTSDHEQENSLEGFNTITLQVKDGVYDSWLRFCEQIEKESGNNSKAYAFEIAIATMLTK